MSVLGNLSRPMRWFHRDRQTYDAITIETVPRFKESGLSGDEWRFSALVKFWQKGNVVATKSCGDVAAACKYLSYWHDTVWEEARGKPTFDRSLYCDQEGCNEKHTVTYLLKAEYSREGYAGPSSISKYVCFCDRHKTRGDCGLEDADRNYEIVER